MYFFISFVLSILSFFEYYLNKNYLIRILLFFSAGIFFFILLGFNTYSPDLENYRIHFQDLEQDYIRLAVEPFILFLMENCKDFGLSFEGYQIVFSFLTFSLFLYSVYKYSPLPVFVLFNFYFIPFFPDIAQIRFFLGFTFFLFSIQFFKNRKLIFYLFLILGLLSHWSIAVFIVFLVVHKYDFFKKQLLCNKIIIISTFLLLIVPINLLDFILELINPKLLLYTQSEDRGTFLGTIVLFLPFFILNNIILYILKNKIPDEFIKNNFKYYKYIPLFKDLIQFSNFLILFQYFIRDFNRITQNIHLITLICFSIFIFYLLKSRKKILANFTLFSVIIVNIFIFYSQFLMVNNFEYFDVIYKTYTSNYFIDLIITFFTI